MKITEVIKCNTLIPNFNTVRVRYEYTRFSTGDVFVNTIMHDDDTHFGSNSQWYKDSDTLSDTGPGLIYRDKQLNDDWSTWTFTVNRTSLDLTISYVDPVDANESYVLPALCTKS